MKSAALYMSEKVTARASSDGRSHGQASRMSTRGRATYSACGTHGGRMKLLIVANLYHLCKKTTWIFFLTMDRVVFSSIMRQIIKYPKTDDFYIYIYSSANPT